MANLTIPLTSVPSTDAQGGSRILNSIRRGSLKFVPQSLYHLPVKYSDFSFAGLTKNLVVGTAFPNRKFPANVFIKPRVYFDLTTEFSGGAVATCTIQAGDSGDANGVLDVVNVFTGAGTGVKVAVNATVTDYAFQAAYDLEVLLTTTVGNIDTLTQGAGILYIVTEAIPRTRA